MHAVVYFVLHVDPTHHIKNKILLVLLVVVLMVSLILFFKEVGTGEEE